MKRACIVLLALSLASCVPREIIVPLEPGSAIRLEWDVLGKVPDPKYKAIVITSNQRIWSWAPSDTCGRQINLRDNRKALTCDPNPDATYRITLEVEGRLEAYYSTTPRSLPLDADLETLPSAALNIQEP